MDHPTAQPPNHLVEDYRRDGFVAVRGLFSPEEALAFRARALAHADRHPTLGRSVFDQYVNVWTHDEGMRDLTLDPRIGRTAAALAGVPLRLWHDQILIKQPGISTPTEFHQDQPYWPHARFGEPISCWIALGDVPVEAGCMTFLPGAQGRRDLRMQDLTNETSFFDLAPDLRYSPRVTLPLRAGDVTFHHGRCPHMANANRSADPRVAFAVIFLQDGTPYDGAPHVVTDPLGLKVGAPVAGDLFPAVG